MKFETLIQNREGVLEIEGDHFTFRAAMRQHADDIQPVHSDRMLTHGGSFSIEPLDEGSYSVLIGTRSYRVTHSRTGELIVNGRTIALEVLDPRALRTRGQGASAQGRQKVTASMPGKIIRLLVAVGDNVEAGQGLVVVEAMKMQNEMKSPKAGRVLEIKTKEGAAVTAGDVLVVVE